MPAKLEASGIKKAIEYVNSGKSLSLKEASPEPEEAVTQLSDLPSPIEDLKNPYTKDTISLSLKENEPVVIQSAFDQLSFLIALVIKKINSEYSIFKFPNENIESTDDVSGYFKEANVKNDASIRNFEIFRFRLHKRTLGINAGPTSEGTKEQIQFFNDVKKAFENIFREKEKFDALNPDELSLNLSGLYFEKCAQGAIQSAKIAAEKIYFSDNHLKSFLDQYFQEQVCKILPNIREKFDIRVHNEEQEGSYHIHHTSFIKAILYMTDKQLAGVPLLINAGDFFLNFPEFSEYYVQESFRNLFLAGQGESTTSEELAVKIAEKRDFLLSIIDPIPLEKIPSETSSLAKAQLNEAVESELMPPMSATVGFASSLLEEIWYPMPDLKKQLPDEISIEDSFSLYWFLKKEGLIELGKWERSDGQLENIIRNECLRKILDKLIEDIEKSNGDSASPEPEPEIADRGRSKMDFLKRIKDDLKGGLHPEVVFGLIHLFYQDNEPSWSFSAFEQKTTKCEGGFEIKEGVIEEGVIDSDSDCLWSAKKAIKYINSPDPRGADTELAQDEKLKEYNKISEFGILKLNKTYYIIYKNEGEHTFISKVSPQFLREFYAIPTQENALHQSNLKKLLIVAVEKNDIEEVEVCINGGADVNAADESGRTPLYAAARNGHSDVAGLLLTAGANPNTPNQYDNTALHSAAQSGHAAVVTALVQAGADLEAKDYDGNTALHWAANYGHEAVARLLLARGADVNAADNFGYTPLYTAARNGHLDVVTALLEKGANIKLLKEESKERVFCQKRLNTLLNTAAHEESIEEIETFINGGADVNAADESGRTPLYTAARNGHSDVAGLLLTAGAEIDAKSNEGWTPLSIAACNGHLDVARLLLTAGADLEAKNNKGDTALIFAARKGHAEVVTALVQAGANPNATNNYGETALHWAVKNDHAAVVTALLDRGADPEAKSNKGNTALIIAASWGHAAVVTALVQAGADLEAKSNKGSTALIWAAKKGHQVVARYLKGFKILVDLDSGFVTAVNIAAKERIDKIRVAALTSPEPGQELIGAGEVVVSSEEEVKDPLEQLKCIFFKRIADSVEEQQVVKYKSDFITLALAVAQLRSYEGSRPDVAREIIDKIIKHTQSEKIFTSDGTLIGIIGIIGIDEVIRRLAGVDYAKVFETTWFNRSLTTLQEVISDVSEILGGESYPDPGSFVELKKELDPKRKSSAGVAQTDPSSSHFFQSAPAAEPEPEAARAEAAEADAAEAEALRGQLAALEATVAALEAIEAEAAEAAAEPEAQAVEPATPAP